MKTFRPAQITSTGNIALGSFRRIDAGRTVRIYASGATGDVLSASLDQVNFINNIINIEISADVIDQSRDYVGEMQALVPAELTASLAGTVTGTAVKFEVW